jgi:hypothetical protein
MKHQKSPITLEDIMIFQQNLSLHVDEKIDQLARITNAGFKAVATKTQVAGLEGRLNSVEKRLIAQGDFFDAIFMELREIRRELRGVDSRADVVDLQVRVSAIEDSVGIKYGKIKGKKQNEPTSARS